jgi:hypothetical protein
MRSTLPVVSFIVMISALASIDPASAQRRHTGQAGIQDRYCLQGRSWGYPGNCQFSSYRQCMATASGTFATCGNNPAYAYARDRRWRR